MTRNDRTNRRAGRATSRGAERRTGMIRQRREQRTADYERLRRNWQLTKAGLTAFAVMVVVVIGWLVYRGIEDRRLAVIPDGVTNYEYAGAQHTTEPVEYTEVPPVGGAHLPTWQNCGFYSSLISNENAVHSLEHGAVWITYSPDQAAEQVELLRQRAKEPYILVSPYEGLPSPVVASAWNHQLRLERADDERLAQFIRSFRNGPDTPEPGAACFGSIGDPE